MRKTICEDARLFEEIAFSAAPLHFLAFEFNLFYIYCLMDELNFNCAILPGTDVEEDWEKEQFFNHLVADITAYVLLLSILSYKLTDRNK